VALWDLVRYKLLKYIPELHTSEVINTKIYHTQDEEIIYAITSEDTGMV
jgi:hypothetical protein